MPVQHWFSHSTENSLSPCGFWGAGCIRVFFFFFDNLLPPVAEFKLSVPHEILLGSWGTCRIPVKSSNRQDLDTLPVKSFFTFLQPALSKTSCIVNIIVRIPNHFDKHIYYCTAAVKHIDVVDCRLDYTNCLQNSGPFVNMPTNLFTYWPYTVLAIRVQSESCRCIVNWLTKCRGKIYKVVVMHADS